MIQSPKSEVEHETKFSLRIFYSTNVWVAEWLRHLPSNSLMVGVVSSVPTGGNFIFCWNIFETLDVNFVQKCQICVENKPLDYFHYRIQGPHTLFWGKNLMLFYVFILWSFSEKGWFLFSHSLLNFSALSICVESFVRSKVGCKSTDDFSSNIISVNYITKIRKRPKVIRFHLLQFCFKLLIHRQIILKAI